MCYNKPMKKFNQWNKIKQKLHKANKQIYFRKKEIWWCSLGINIGYEQDGKNNNFERPVLIIKKFNKNVLWILPLTKAEKINNKYYFQLNQNRENSFVILSQIRLISSNRLLRKMRKMRQNEFQQIKNKIKTFFS